MGFFERITHMSEPVNDPENPIAHMERDRARANTLSFVLHPHNPHQEALLEQWGVRPQNSTPPTTAAMSGDLKALAAWLMDVVEYMDAQHYAPVGYASAFRNHLAAFSQTVAKRAKQAAHGAEYDDLFPIRMEFPLHEGGHEHTLPEDMVGELETLKNLLNMLRYMPTNPDPESPPRSAGLIRSFAHQMEFQAKDLELHQRSEQFAQDVLDSSLPQGESRDAAPPGSRPWLDRLAKATQPPSNER